MTTINLRDGLEALYYFGEQDFKPQRNLLQDHSGYGRHASTNGSITFGNEGRNNFASANFTPSSNDQLVTPLSDFTGVTEMTLAAHVDVDSGNDAVIFSNAGGNDNSGFEVTVEDAGNNLIFQYYNDDGTVQFTRDLSYFGGGPTFVFITVSPNSIRYMTINDGEILVRAKSNGYDSIALDNNEDKNLRISGNPNSSDFLSGNISFAGVWFRVLSIAELREIIRLTARRRAQL